MQVALYGRCVFWRSWLDVGTIVGLGFREVCGLDFSSFL